MHSWSLFSSQVNRVELWVYNTNTTEDWTNKVDVLGKFTELWIATMLWRHGVIKFDNCAGLFNFNFMYGLNLHDQLIHFPSYVPHSHFVFIISSSTSGSRQDRLFYKSTKVFARLFTSFYFLPYFYSMAERTDRMARELDPSPNIRLDPCVLCGFFACFFFRVRK